MLHLEWCKAFSCGADQKLGGWVSENTFGWVRLSRWLHHGMSNVVADAPYIEPDHIPVDKFTLKQCKSWLVAHGLSFKSKDRVSILRQLIVSAKSNEVSPPEMVWRATTTH